MLATKVAIDPVTGEPFRSAFDPVTCLPIEPIQRFLNYCRKRRLASNTVETYLYRLVTFWKWLEYKALSWVDLEPSQLVEFADWYLLDQDIEVAAEEVLDSVSKRSPKTVNQAITAIQEFYEFHHLEGRIGDKKLTRLAKGRKGRRGFLAGIAKDSPSTRKRIKFKEPKTFPGCLADEKMVQLIDACSTYRDKLQLLLMRETGLRRGELLGLHLIDIQDLDVSGRINVVRRENSNKAWSKGVERVIPVLHNRKTVQDVLRAYLLEEYPPQAEQLGHGMLFVNLEGKHIGQPMSLGRLNKLFQQLHTRTGIKAYPHLLRHTFATRMLQQGYLDQYVQQLMGHRSITTTKDIYSHVLEEMKLSVLMSSQKNP